MEMDELKESNSRGNDRKRSRKEEKNGLVVLFFEPEMLQPWPRLIPVSVQTAPRGPSRHSL